MEEIVMKNYLISFKCNEKLIKSVVIQSDRMINALQTFMEAGYEYKELLSIIKFK